MKIEKKYKLITKAFNFAKDYFPASSSKKLKKKKKIKLEDKFIEKIEWRVFLISLRQRYEYFQAFKIIDNSGDGKLDL